MTDPMIETARDLTLLCSNLNPIRPFQYHLRLARMLGKVEKSKVYSFLKEESRGDPS